ncbi:class I SAM-dependent methyltransferase [Nocardiopsis sp. EMB25]|uniref:class I SAM-dependent methyltransferase n=1 Tax=Nocardiopsis TaxID=2013 RepID=UPI00034A4363|nr:MULTISPECIES: class I SAM-dependent methyltransferase [Nocardiopsis]MCY9787287.1 class I SAM-dependent methyltransferase [Nocardiopsis sp. EMB25]
MIIPACRVCDNRELIPVLDLGEQALTGVFPRSREEVVPEFPLELVKCSPSGCGLVQLRHTPDPGLMYGEGYGYRSGIRPFMVDHLRGKVESVRRRVELGAGDIVVDIGSNDATLLRSYPDAGLRRVGIDPTGGKFRDRYPDDAELIVDYFSRDVFTERFGDERARVVTSIAMFYDLPDPLAFMRDVRDILADDGVWLMEQSYLPSMLEADAYDIVCHEHLEYYALRQIEWMAERVGLTVLSAEITDVYGGSLCVTLARSTSPHTVDENGLDRVRALESQAKIDTMAPFETFARRVEHQRDALRSFLADSLDAGRLTAGYGASTKGNVILQYCGITERELPCVGEVSPEKAGRFTPGTRIPIVSEEEAKAMRPDQLLVLPWIYRKGFVERERDFLASGGRLVFPLPELDTV